MSYLLNEISWYDYQDKIKNQHILIIPIGATEQHGPHLPLGVDAMLATAFSLALAKQINGVVAPTLNYGYKSLPLSGGGPFFPGTIDLNGNEYPYPANQRYRKRICSRWLEAHCNF